jgi:hypothetical protein
MSPFFGAWSMPNRWDVSRKFNFHPEAIGFPPETRVVLKFGTLGFN